MISPTQAKRNEAANDTAINPPLILKEESGQGMC